MLSHTISTFDAALVNEVRAHYHDPEKHPAPGGKGGDTVLAELTNFLESSGGSDPLAKIYITSDPLEGLPAALLLFTVSYAPKFVYDRNFGTLVRAKPKYPVDSAPIVVGMATVLKQYHPSVTRQVSCPATSCLSCRLSLTHASTWLFARVQFLAYCGQFVRSMVDSCFMKEAKVTALPIEALNVLLMLEQFCRFAQIPRSVLTGFVPDYIYDAIDIDSAQPVGQ